MMSGDYNVKKATSYGQAIRRLIDELGTTSYQLGKQAGVTSASLSLILNDKRQPSVTTLELLLRAAGKPWAWLDDNLEASSSPQPRGRPKSAEADDRAGAGEDTAEAKPAKKKGKGKK